MKKNQYSVSVCQSVARGCRGLPGTKLPCTTSLYAHHPSWIFGGFGCAVGWKKRRDQFDLKFRQESKSLVLLHSKPTLTLRIFTLALHPIELWARLRLIWALPRPPLGWYGYRWTLVWSFCGITTLTQGPGLKCSTLGNSQKSSLKYQQKVLTRRIESANKNSLSREEKGSDQKRLTGRIKQTQNTHLEGITATEQKTQDLTWTEGKADYKHTQGNG